MTQRSPAKYVSCNLTITDMIVLCILFLTWNMGQFIFKLFGSSTVYLTQVSSSFEQNLRRIVKPYQTNLSNNCRFQLDCQE